MNYRSVLHPILALSKFLKPCHRFNLVSRTIGVLAANSLLPPVSVSHIKNILKNLNVPCEDGYTCLKTQCSQCKNVSLFVNKTSGYSLCFSCLKSGEWHSSDGETHCELKDEDSFKTGSIIWRDLTSQFELFESDKHLSRFQSSHPEVKDCANTLLSLGAVISSHDNSIYVPLSSFNSLSVGYKCITENGDESSFPADSPGIILHKPTSGRVNKCILVASVKDLLSLTLSNPSYEIVCLPHGVQCIPQEILPLLEEFDKIVLWLGDEPLAWDNARTFARKLGDSRCYLIQGEGPHKILTNYKHPIPYIKKCLAAAQPVTHSAITKFSALRQDVLDMLTNVDKVSGVKWKRFPELNDLLRGHRRGELTVLTGPTGSGKTTFMSEYSVDLASQGVCTLWGSFEVRNSRLARTMLLQYSRKSEILESFDFWADAFQLLPMYFMTFHGQQSLETVMDAVRHATYVHDIGHVIIDNVQFMLGLSSVLSGNNNPFIDRFYRQDALIAAFRTFATECNCHVTLVIHPRKERESELLTPSSIFGGAKASQEADNILILQTKTVGTPPRTSKYLQVAKNRYSGDLGVVHLHFDKSILSFEKKTNKK